MTQRAMPCWAEMAACRQKPEPILETGSGMWLLQQSPETTQRIVMEQQKYSPSKTSRKRSTSRCSVIQKEW